MRSKVTLSLILSLVLVINQFFSYPVFAEVYSISGNGDGSSNNIEVKKEDSQNVSQSNQAQVNNEVKSEADTGNNEASGNSGETSVETGDAEQNVVVENSGNVNQASSGCCPSDTGYGAEISGNGGNSDNQIKYQQKTGTKASQNNSAKINNNFYISANTGENEASNNSGDTTIKTGDVNISVGAKQVVNHSVISLGKAQPGLNLKISGNGAGSSNSIDDQYYSDDEYFVNNYLELNNNIWTYTNTGGNKANKNNGKVLIATGNVYLDIILSNKVNSSVIKTECGCKSVHPSPTSTPSGSPSPSTPPSGGENGGGGNGGSGGSGGSVGSSGSGGSSGGGQVLGVTLPATGGFSLIQASVFALGLLFSGIILKLDMKLPFKKHVKKIRRDIIFDYFYEFKKVVGELINFKLPLPVPRYIPAYY